MESHRPRHGQWNVRNPPPHRPQRFGGPPNFQNSSNLYTGQHGGPFNQQAGGRPLNALNKNMNEHNGNGFPTEHSRFTRPPFPPPGQQSMFGQMQGFPVTPDFSRPPPPIQMTGPPPPGAGNPGQVGSGQGLQMLPNQAMQGVAHQNLPSSTNTAQHSVNGISQSRIPPNPTINSVPAKDGGTATPAYLMGISQLPKQNIQQNSSNFAQGGMANNVQKPLNIHNLNPVSRNSVNSTVPYSVPMPPSQTAASPSNINFQPGASFSRHPPQGSFSQNVQNGMAATYSQGYGGGNFSNLMTGNPTGVGQQVNNQQGLISNSLQPNPGFGPIRFSNNTGGNFPPGVNVMPLQSQQTGQVPGFGLQMPTNFGQSLTNNCVNTSTSGGVLVDSRLIQNTSI